MHGEAQTGGKKKNFLSNYFYVKSLIINLIINFSPSTHSLAPSHGNTFSIALNQFYGPELDRHHCSHKDEIAANAAIKLAVYLFPVEFCV